METYFSFNDMPQAVYETKHSVEERRLKNEMHGNVPICDMHFGMESELILGISVRFL